MLGGFILSCAAIGLWGFFDGVGPGHRNKDIGLVIFNWALIASSEFGRLRKSSPRADLLLGRAAIITLVVASIIWIFTLTERADFEKVWLEQNGETQAFLQDSVS